jgi:hypothetical protein
MWMVPPDIGAKVMVIFIDGDPNQGYYFGCVQDIFQNHMTPGIAASRQVSMTDEQRRKYGTDYLPVAEFHNASQKLDRPTPERYAKPIHPFADRLLQQGLLLDTTRGVTSSSARREVPSGVFGISTPGPLDDSPGAKRGKIGYEGNTQAPVSRLGGTTFVMDDGDVNGQNELVLFVSVWVLAPMCSKCVESVNTNICLVTILVKLLVSVGNFAWALRRWWHSLLSHGLGFLHWLVRPRRSIS